MEKHTEKLIFLNLERLMQKFDKLGEYVAGYDEWHKDDKVVDPIEGMEIDPPKEDKEHDEQP